MKEVKAVGIVAYRYDKLAAAEQLDDLAQAEIHEDDTGRDEGEQQ